jgi:C_GCAxxG_C_C family probable redox protein
MENKEVALIYFDDQLNCSQAVFSAYSEMFGVSEDDAIKIAAGFGGGIGRTQETCGALTGAVMALGCKFFDINNVEKSKNLIYEKTSELLSKFKEIHKSTYCLDLTGIDFSKEGGRELFKKMNIQEKVCRNCIVDVCNILDEMIK